MVERSGERKHSVDKWFATSVCLRAQLHNKEMEEKKKEQSTSANIGQIRLSSFWLAGVEAENSNGHRQHSLLVYCLIIALLPLTTSTYGGKAKLASGE